MTALLPGQDVGELVAVLDAGLREVIEPANDEEVTGAEATDARARRGRIILRELQVAPNIRDAELVKQVRSEDMGLADRRILIQGSRIRGEK